LSQVFYPGDVKSASSLHCKFVTYRCHSIRNQSALPAPLAGFWGIIGYRPSKAVIVARGPEFVVTPLFLLGGSNPAKSSTGNPNLNLKPGHSENALPSDVVSLNKPL